MVEYGKANVKLSDTQLKKLKTAAKNRTGTTLSISLKMFNGNDLPNELLLTTRQKTKPRNAFNNMSTDLKLSKAQMSKIIQSEAFLGSLLSWFINESSNSFCKKCLVPLGITAAASAFDAEIQKNTWFWNNNFNNFK